jgi:hypothetical protein
MFFSRKISVRVCILCSKVAGKIELHWNTRGNLTIHPRVPPGVFMLMGAPTWGVRTAKHFYIGPRACPRRDSKFCLVLNFKCDLLIYAPPPPLQRNYRAGSLEQTFFFLWLDRRLRSFSPSGCNEKLVLYRKTRRNDTCFLAI